MCRHLGEDGDKKRQVFEKLSVYIRKNIQGAYGENKYVQLLDGKTR